jgi:uncharacterized protein YbjT (DUF2867 family)
MSSPILVTGGTGTLGRHVVPLLRGAGHEVRVLSRNSHQPGDGVEHITGDLLAGHGIEAAVQGVDTVLHLAGGPKGDDQATSNLVQAAARADVQHLVLISVIGADTVPVAWLRTKYAAERAVVESGVPWTTLRAAQFHELLLGILDKMARLPVIPIPTNLRLEPVYAREVAERLLELTLGRPAGHVADLAGPQVLEMTDLARRYLRVTGRRRMMMPLRLPGKAGRAYRAGENLASISVTRGETTWDEFLALQARERKTPNNALPMQGRS